MLSLKTLCKFLDLDLTMYFEQVARRAVHFFHTSLSISLRHISVHVMSIGLTSFQTIYFQVKHRKPQFLMSSVQSVFHSSGVFHALHMTNNCSRLFLRYLPTCRGVSLIVLVHISSFHVIFSIQRITCWTFHISVLVRFVVMNALLAGVVLWCFCQTSCVHYEMSRVGNA